MSHPGESIHELKAKIGYLAEALYEAGKIPSAARRLLAEHCGIKPKSLDSACRSERMTRSMQNEISNVCRFSLDEPTWIDRRFPLERRHNKNTSVRRLDGATEFRSKIRNIWGLDDGFFLSISGFIPNSKDPDFASFALTDLGQVTPLGADLNVFLEMDLSPGFDETGFGYGFRKVRVRAELDRTEISRITNRFASEGPIQLKDATVAARGTRYEPCWDVTTRSRVLSGEYFVSNDAPLFALSVDSVPCSISAHLTVHLHDGSLLSVDGAELPNANKSRIIERLYSLMFDESPSIDGRIRLCSQTLKVHRK